jgi:hypothetical protein
MMVERRVRWPAMGLLLVGALFAALPPLILLLVLATAGPPPEWIQGLIAVTLVLLATAVGTVIIVGAVNMLRFQSHGWAMTAAVLALLPCGPACLIGVPVGIWAILVLTAPEVKAAFDRRERGPL